MFRWWNRQGGILFGTLVFSALAAGVGSYSVGTIEGPQIGRQSIILASLVTGSFAAVVFRPLAVTHPRRITTLLEITWKRVVIVCLGLGTVGYMGVLEGLSPWTVLTVGGLLGIGLPVWFWGAGRNTPPDRVLVVGDDPSQVTSVVGSLPVEPIGLLSPSLAQWATDSDAVPMASNEPAEPTEPVEEPPLADGGVPISDGGALTGGLERIGGLSRLEDTLRNNDVDTVALAFTQGDREEFFGVLQVCHDSGVDVLAHKSLSDHVLVGEEVGEKLVDVDLEPLTWYSRTAKRAFDIVFAVVGLVALAPLIALIAVAIKLDSPGPVLYSQTRTSELGQEFTVLKFRSMVTDAEAETGATLSSEDAGDVDPRVTRIGRILRTTHIDEIPQLTSVLAGDMSAVGPRPERPALDQEIEADGVGWSKRWFVKPGLTGISQVRGVTGFDPVDKLEYDLEYARRQSLWLDTKLVSLQIWSVIEDVIGMLSNRLGDNTEREGTRRK